MIDYVPLRIDMLQPLFKQLKFFIQGLLGTYIIHFILHRLLHQLDYQYADHTPKGFVVKWINRLRYPHYFGYYRRFQQVHQSRRRDIGLPEMLKLVVDLS